MKILGHRHTGIIVNDFDKMLDFYVGLGLVLRRHDFEEGPFIDGLLGTDNILLETAKLILEDEGVPVKYRFQLELMKIKNKYVETKEIFEHSAKFNFFCRPIGILDIAFTVDDIDSVLRFIVKHGGNLIGEPLEAVAGFPALHCYARDPEGNVLHIAENLSA
jgi:catechol 2,3-dioxygenase-like lactoylglutathione lyase family enzyme